MPAMWHFERCGRRRLLAGHARTLPRASATVRWTPPLAQEAKVREARRSFGPYSSLRRPLSSWACVETPNPKVRKFEPPPASPLAAGLSEAARAQLLGLEGVHDVFVADRRPATEAAWVAVTCADGTSWDALVPRVQELLGGLPEAVEVGARAAASLAQPEVEAEETPQGIEGTIAEVIDARVRPSVQADGGDVELVSWDANAGEVTLRLRGACQGCPHSAATLQDSILRTLRHFVPEVKNVVSEEVVIESSIDPYADIPWEHHGEAEPAAILALSAAGTPFFSTFAGMKVEGRMLRRVRFASRLELAGRRPEHVFVNCPDCNVRRTIEDPLDLLRADKGNTTGDAAVVICPTCCVVITP